LGNGYTQTQTSPLEITAVTGSVYSIDAGYSHSLAVLTDGTVLAWGDNDSGKLDNSNSFNDIEQHWAKNAIIAAHASGMVEGFE
jgi:alpha-tubulin suppressor-like RCC1 family protein